MWNNESSMGEGGFMNDSMQSTGKKGPQNDKTIVPVLIKHITSTTGDLQIAGRTVNVLSLVGIVRHIEQDTTKISFNIQDDTGIYVLFMVYFRFYLCFFGLNDNHVQLQLQNAKSFDKLIFHLLNKFLFVHNLYK